MILGLRSITLLGFLLLAFSGGAFAEGISREQGDAIINELRQIRQLLGKQQRAEAAPAAPAPQERVRLKLGNDYSLGQGDAPLVMVEYTDYQCPYCNRFYTGAFPELKKQYIDTGKMRFITRDFPLDFHPHAMKAAQASRCAGEQGKFWQMKDALMTNSSQLNPELIAVLARDRGLDMAKFSGCMDGGKVAAGIKDGIAQATAIGITGTPSFVIGRVSEGYLDGFLVVGAQPFANFDALAKKLLLEKK